MQKILFLQTSLSPHSKSFLLIQEAMKMAQAKGYETELIDLRKLDLPFCDGRALTNYPQALQTIYDQIEKADYLIIGMAVYCYSLSGVLKNFIDLFAKSFKNKRFGVCAAAGSKMSYLGTSDLVKILGYESSATGVQPVVLTDHTDFNEEQIIDPTVIERIERMLNSLITCH